MSRRRNAKVLINGRAPITQASGAKATAFPDVCLTPVMGAMVPVPYVNIAKASDLTGGTVRTNIGGASVMTDKSKLSTSTGNEQGVGGGVVSRKTKGSAQAMPIPNLGRVTIEGKRVVLEGAVTLQNGGNAIGKFDSPNTP